MPTKYSVQIAALSTACVCALALLLTTARSIELLLSLDWPTTRAEVTESHTTEHAGRRGRRRTVVHLTFQYRVEGRTYRSSRVSFFDWGPGSPRDTPSYALSTYPRGSTVEMHYNPDDPSDSVIENDIPPRVAVLVFTGIFVGTIAGYITLAPMGLATFLKNLIGRPEDVAQSHEWLPEEKNAPRRPARPDDDGRSQDAFDDD